jgi:hypothetical protein
MHSWADPSPAPGAEREKSTVATQAEAVLAREAGVPFAPVPDSTTPTDPFVEWLSLMEVVEMLCPVWPVREHPMRGAHWRL